ncbi:NAD(P)-dependent alcohol dehydrogenase [Nocardia sp. NPDC019395]|uniref:zinc-dependent alcohol dehydrogenase family protein n=1 Tax=Nocardia sp. NPDC019395 TaxID=3154686 RepID=UPI003405A922
MKAVRLTPEGDRKKPELRDEPVPVPERQEVLIRVHAASLNFRDQAILAGQYPGSVRAEGIPLSDGAGEVVAVGSDVTRVKVGDRVAANCAVHWIGGPHLPEYQSASVGMTIDGMLAEYVTLHENALVHLPAYLSYAEAASLPCAAVSAWSALHVATPLRPGQTVLIQGTGGVALFGLQIARLFGARVLAITSTDEKAEKLVKLGAESVVNYRARPDWDREILDLTGGKGVDKVVDIAGEATIVKSAASAKIGGEIGLVGFASGFGGGLPPIDILSRTLTIAGIGVGPRTNFEALLATMAAGETKPVIDQVFPFTEYREAYRRIDSGNHVGKVVVDITR